MTTHAWFVSFWKCRRTWSPANIQKRQKAACTLGADRLSWSTVLLNSTEATLMIVSRRSLKTQVAQSGGLSLRALPTG